MYRKTGLVASKRSFSGDSLSTASSYVDITLDDAKSS
jgi:hypothetical protein